MHTVIKGTEVCEMSLSAATFVFYNYFIPAPACDVITPISQVTFTHDHQLQKHQTLQVVTYNNNNEDTALDKCVNNYGYKE